jgi:hypothetical protein
MPPVRVADGKEITIDAMSKRGSVLLASIDHHIPCFSRLAQQIEDHPVFPLLNWNRRRSAVFQLMLV